MDLSPILPSPISSARLWFGRILSGVLVVAMLADAISHLLKPVPVVDAFHQLGLPLHLSIG